MSKLEVLLEAVVADPQDKFLWMVLADWLEENDDPRRAELLRLHRRLLATCCEPERHPERAGWQARVVELLGQGVMPCVPQKTVELGDGVEMAFGFIPPGSFLMGESDSSDAMIYRAEVTEGLGLGVHPVTQAQWAAVMGVNPGGFQGGDRPVEMVSWEDCVACCVELEKRTGLAFRLPADAEWEYACRAGTTTAFWFGQTMSSHRAHSQTVVPRVALPRRLAEVSSSRELAGALP